MLASQDEDSGPGFSAAFLAAVLAEVDRAGVVCESPALASATAHALATAASAGALLGSGDIADSAAAARARLGAVDKSVLCFPSRVAQLVWRVPGDSGLAAMASATAAYGAQAAASAASAAAAFETAAPAGGRAAPPGFGGAGAGAGGLLKPQQQAALLEGLLIALHPALGAGRTGVASAFAGSTMEAMTVAAAGGSCTKSNGNNLVRLPTAGGGGGASRILLVADDDDKAILAAATGAACPLWRKIVHGAGGVAAVEAVLSAAHADGSLQRRLAGKQVSTAAREGSEGRGSLARQWLAGCCCCWVLFCCVAAKRG